VPAHLRPTAPIAPDALLPGDPGRALALAQDILVKPLMSNHNRGLWGYHGQTAGGAELTIQSTGIGGPSATIVLTELAGLGVRRAIRVGTCASLSVELAPGELIVATEALAQDGTSRDLGAGPAVPAAEELTRALSEAAAAPALPVETTDLFYGRNGGVGGAAAWEMEAAPLFAAGARLGVEVACILTVVARGEDAISEERLAAAELEMGRAAAAALGAQPAVAEPSSTSSRA
jgi:uridine phosphorylase